MHYIHELLNVCDTIYHDLIIAKLRTYCSSQDALQYTKSYLTDRRQTVWVNSNFSTWKSIIVADHYGLILGPLLFNIFINDLTLSVSNSHLGNHGEATLFMALQSGRNEEYISFWFWSSYTMIRKKLCSSKY